MTGELSVLVVEDDAEKSRRVIRCLVQHGIDSEHIEVAGSVQQAKRFLQTKFFDLMLLDISLPVMLDEQPRMDGGVMLLEELVERRTLIRPAYVVGLTAFAENINGAGKRFAEKAWTVIKYENESDEWCKPIGQLISHIFVARKGNDDAGFLTDICIVTALSKTELRAVLDLDWGWKEERLARDHTEYYRGSLNCEGRVLSVVVGCASRMGMVPSAVLATKMVLGFRPRLLAMVGICAGIKGAVNLGDVICADPVWNYQSGKRVEGSAELLIDPHQIPIAYAVRRRAMELARDDGRLSNIRSKWRGSKPSTELALHVEAVGTGAQVIADEEIVKEVKKQHRRLYGIEMEIYGVFTAAHEAQEPVPHFVSFKGVSDFADADKSDDYRDYAAYAAARSFEIFCERYFGVK